MNEPLIAGEHVTLRPGSEGDLDWMLEMVAHPDVARWWGSYDRDRMRRELFAGGALTLVVMVSAEPIGFVTIWEQREPDYRHASLDISLKAGWQGKGHGSDALLAVARHLFREHGHHRLTIDPSVDNERAIACYRKVGFRPVGVMRQYERRTDGAWHDGLLMDLLASDVSR